MFSYLIRQAGPQAFFWRVVDFDGDVVGQGVASGQSEACMTAERLIATYRGSPATRTMSVEHSA